MSCTPNSGGFVPPSTVGVGLFLGALRSRSWPVSLLSCLGSEALEELEL